MEVKSPVTAKYNTLLIDRVPVQYIIEGYQELLGINVDRFFLNLDFVDIYQCNDTGFRFYYPETIFGDAAFYAQLQKKDFYYNQWIWENKVALKQLPPGGNILEVGCGTGTFMEHIAGKGFSITGLELNDAAVAVCKSKGLNVYNELLEKHIENNTGKYDVICSFQVLEHVYDVRSFINCCLQCLKPSGKLILAVPNNDPWYYKYDKLHLMNLPPHHSGLWNRKVFERLPDFFSLTTDKILFEPLYNRLQFLNTWLLHKKYIKLHGLVKKLPPGIVNRLLWPLQWFINGKCVVAIFNKK